MREILFRGKRLFTCEWKEGYLVRKPCAVQCGDNDGSWYIETPPRDPDDRGQLSPVYSETVGQFTGLTDKHGKRIFEGDIVKCIEITRYTEIEFISPVVFLDGSWFLHESEDCDVYLYNYDNESKSRLWEIEVIGNIHDNPELLNTEREGTE